MAVRPVFCVSEDERIFIRKNVEFPYSGGFSEVQKRKNIKSLHRNFAELEPQKAVLEISGKSEEPLGVKLSAFNLTILSKTGKPLYSVESAFQGSKVFEKGGPYTELLQVSSREAKRDERLRSSGAVIGFLLNGTSYPTEPRTFFYDWIYVNTLNQHADLAEQVLRYDAFTDIEFNPNRSLNCQAQSAAIFVSLHRQGMLEYALRDREIFRDIVYRIS